MDEFVTLRCPAFPPTVIMTDGMGYPLETVDHANNTAEVTVCGRHIKELLARPGFSYKTPPVQSATFDASALCAAEAAEAKAARSK